jgi:predicted nucleic-acid-binding Zn-ribbon protein
MPEKYCCPRCGNFSFASLWNFATWKYLRRDYGSLLNIGQERPNRMWVCPLCYRTSANEEIIAATNEHRTY